MKYRVWLDHPESGSHMWASSIVHLDLEDAIREFEMLQDQDSTGIDYTVINLSTGYPYYISPEEAERQGFKKRSMSPYGRSERL